MGDLNMAVALDLQVAAAVGFFRARGLAPLRCCCSRDVWVSVQGVSERGTTSGSYFPWPSCIPAWANTVYGHLREVMPPKQRWSEPVHALLIIFCCLS